MAQIYPKNPSNFRMKPKRKTIQFILNFSKSFKTVTIQNNILIELNLN